MITWSLYPLQQVLFMWCLPSLGNVDVENRPAQATPGLRPGPPSASRRRSPPVGARRPFALLLPSAKRVSCLDCVSESCLVRISLNQMMTCLRPGDDYGQTSRAASHNVAVRLVNLFSARLGVEHLGSLKEQQKS
jgi:hypothetical protein